MSKEIFKSKLAELVATFARNKEDYKDTHFKEAQLRIQFIDPMFKALGWDMNNERGYAEAYKDVVHEDRIQIKGKEKAPDYSFRIDGGRKFFLEAKKPFVKIKSEYDPAYQLRRYAWSAHLPISILSDFEEFAVYDTTIQPKLADNTTVGRLEYFTYEEYLDKADWLYDTFSREAIPLGSFDKYAKKEKRGNQVVDKVFLKEIESWREWLAIDIAKNNKDLSVQDLNFAVQKIIDRIIFLRIAEDRGIEEYENLKNLVKNENSYKALVKYFKIAEDKYNSGLFNFGKDEESDTITPKLLISDKVLDKILSNLYYPKSPYEFSMISVELLGSIYEQFLGKVIKLTTSHNAKVEEKPEVRKAGGVYYTPQYIVEYIVKNTVGELVKDKTPKEVAKLKIVDPACGSGSFLIGAYEYLLEWHGSYYDKLSDKEKEKLESNGTLYRLLDKETGIENWNLSTKHKKEILLNNIYGVDIDGQAVEVTKLSLALKMLENENQETIGSQMKLFAERILPDLSSNIKCGNSLIGSDYWDGKDLSLLSDEEIRKVNAFDWEKEFAGVYRQGGFDAVVGNPPYIRIQGLQEFAFEQVPFLKQKYKSASKGNVDIYGMFLELALNIMNENGLAGYILPHKFFQADFAAPLRQLILKNKSIKRIINFKEKQIFENASTYTCLFFMSANQNEKFEYTQIDDRSPQEFLQTARMNLIDSKTLNYSKWVFTNGQISKVLDKLNLVPTKLEAICEKIFVGLQTSADKIYVLKIIEESKDTFICFSNQLQRNVEIEKGFVKPFLMGKDVHRYMPVKPNNVVIFPYLINSAKAELMSERFIIDNFPLGYSYILENKKFLENRENGKFKSTWWQYSRPQNMVEFQHDRLITPEISLGNNMTFSEGNIFHTTKVYSFVFKSDLDISKYYVLGILNSIVLWFFLSNTGYVLRGGYFTFKTNYLKPFPFKTINFQDVKEKKLHYLVANLVENLLETQKQLHAESTSEAQKKILQQRADALDNEIDVLVYELYGLTEQEIEVIENDAK